ncbi:MAG: LamG domain-containing protein, partial [Lentisphaerae bacterium]|nr:LamG domain-containing protein [Lentisphaerota bacterium]
MGFRFHQGIGRTLIGLCTVAAVHAIELPDIQKTQEAVIAKLKARPDCLVWYDMRDPTAQKLRFIPGPDKGVLTPKPGRWPGQEATGVFLGKLMREAIHIPDSGFTLCCWLRVNDLQKVDRLGHKRLAGGVMAVGSGYYNGWRLSVNPGSSALSFGLGRPEIGSRRLASTGYLTSGTWHHVAVTWDHETLAMWIDGTLRAETVATTAYHGEPTAKWFRIGECDSGVGVLDFDIADVAFFSDVLPAETLMDLGDPDREFKR